MRARNCRFFIPNSSAHRLLVAGLLALLVVLGAGWTRSADTAHAADTSQRGLDLKQLTRSWRAVTHFARPHFLPKRTVNVHSARQFWRAWNRLRPGDEIDARAVTFSGEAVFSKRLTGWAEVHFDAGTRFVGTSGENLPAAWINRSQHIRFYGGNLTNPAGGPGITIYDSSYVTWWNFVVHDTANTGLFVQGIHQPNMHLDLKGEISRWGLNLALDPHSEKGTGLHGANLADSPYGVSDSRFVLDLHDGATGAGVEAGGRFTTDLFSHNTLDLRCRNLTKVATTLTAGNCAQLWGRNVTRNDFRYIQAENLTGLPYETGGMYEGQSLKTDTVSYGRAIRTNLNPRAGSAHWDRRHGTVFQRVLPVR